MARCSVRCLKQRDDILAGHRAVDDLCVFDLREYRRDDLANLGAWHTGVLERMRYVEARKLSDEIRGAIGAFEGGHARILRVELDAEALRDRPKRSGAISAMKRITCGSVMHEVTPCATSHLGPIRWPSACETPKRVFNPPKIES